MWSEERRDGGQAGCRIVGVFGNGRTLQVNSSEIQPSRAVDQALERFRRTAHRMLARDRTPVDRASRDTVRELGPVTVDAAG